MPYPRTSDNIVFKWPILVDDTDVVYRKAIEFGAESVMEPADQFYGDRNTGVKDSSGNYWWIATHI